MGAHVDGGQEKMKRIIQLDILRGMLLLMMVVNHSSTPWKLLTDQPIGFCSSAEGFVFVSAFLAGLLFQRRSENLGFRAAREAALARALRIYQVHLGTLFFAFTVGGVFLAELPGVRHVLNQYFCNPWAAIPSSLVLTFQPPLMDILPMYIIFSLLTPLAFWAATKWGWTKVFIASVLAWVASQFHLRELLLVRLQSFPFLNPGPFDLSSWQLLWIGGLYFGKSVQEKRPMPQLSARAETFLLVFGIFFLFLRWYSVAAPDTAIAQVWILDKWHLGPLRILNFFAIAWFASKLFPLLERWQNTLRPLCWVGQNMLPVFASQTCLSLILLAIIEPGKSNKPVGSVLVCIQLLSAFWIAWMFHCRTRNRQLHANQPRLATG